MRQVRPHVEAHQSYDHDLHRLRCTEDPEPAMTETLLAYYAQRSDDLIAAFPDPSTTDSTEETA